MPDSVGSAAAQKYDTAASVLCNHKQYLKLKRPWRRTCGGDRCVLTPSKSMTRTGSSSTKGVSTGTRVMISAGSKGAPGLNRRSIHLGVKASDHKECLTVMKVHVNSRKRQNRFVLRVS